jgi:hypothetical protein
MRVILCAAESKRERYGPAPANRFEGPRQWRSRLRHSPGRCPLDRPESLGTPALADTGEARVISQPLRKPETAETPDCQLERPLLHELAVMSSVHEEASTHESDRCPEGDAGKAVVSTR